MPVHAFAYNWTQSPFTSGKSLAHYIDSIIAQHNGARPCKKVLLVTHSMGGIVARAAMALHGAANKVMGAVHGMMPMAGAPVVYMQAKMGFAQPSWRSVQHMQRQDFVGESLFALLMGPTGMGVSRVLGYLPGALSLLPSCHYRDGSNHRAWITSTPKQAGASIALPSYGDPYEEVYRCMNEDARLFFVPPMCRHATLPCHREACWQQALSVVDDIELLHRRLGLWCHPQSHHIVGVGIPTLDCIQLRVANDGPARTARAVGLDTTLRGDGDGTVPVSSALSGLSDGTRIARMPGVAHSSAMQMPQMVSEVRRRITLLAHNYIAEGLLP